VKFILIHQRAEPLYYYYSLPSANMFPRELKNKDINQGLARCHVTRHRCCFCYWRRGSVVRASVFDWRTFPDMRLIYGWRVTTSWVRRPLWVNQPGQRSLLPSVGRGMSSISVASWVKLLAAVSPSSEYLYEGKADVVYLQVTVWSTSERLVVEILTIGAIQVRFLSFPYYYYYYYYYYYNEKQTWIYHSGSIS